MRNKNEVKTKTSAAIIPLLKNMSIRSNKGLMLVDNPKILFRSLCLLKDKAFTAEEYLPILGSLTKKGKVHKKTRDTYFYTANIFNLIEETSKASHKYTITPVCKEICRAMDNELEKQTYQKYLKGLLLCNKEKGSIFKRLLKYTSVPRKSIEIIEEFGKVPAKTLLAFSKEAGLIVEYGGLIKSIETKSSVTIQEFCSSLLRIYRKLSEDPKRNTQMIYAPIDLIRNTVCLDLGLESRDLFDSLISRILDSSLGVNIYLHGAAPQIENEFDGLTYKGKRYAYISIRSVHGKNEEMYSE